MGEPGVLGGLPVLLEPVSVLVDRLRRPLRHERTQAGGVCERVVEHLSPPQPNVLKWALGVVDDGRVELGHHLVFVLHDLPKKRVLAVEALHSRWPLLPSWCTLLHSRRPWLRSETTEHLMSFGVLGLRSQ